MYNLKYILLFQVTIIIINTFIRYYYLNECIEQAFEHDNKYIIKESLYSCLNLFYTKN
jgi:hypothetical protein